MRRSAYGALRAHAFALTLALAVVFGGQASAGGQRATATKKAAKKKVERPTLARSQAQSHKVSGRGFRLGSLGERGKFRRVHRFGQGEHARMQKHVAKRLGSGKADRATATAAIVRLMDTGFLRVGGESFANRTEDPSFGAATLRKENVTVKGSSVVLTFRGKSGVPWRKTLRDPELAKAITVFLKQPGDRLFQDPTASGKMVKVTAAHVRAELKPFGIVPKDLRTFHANRIFQSELAKMPKPKSAKDVERNIQRARGRAAFALRHEAATSNQSYLDPRLAAVYRRQFQRSR